MADAITDSIIDERTNAEKQATWGFIVGNSDWGDSRLYVVRPVKEENESQVIMDVMRTERSDLKRVRYVSGTGTKSGLMYKPKLRAKDRVHIYNFATFLPKGAGCVHVGGRVSHYPICGNILSSAELAQGVTDVLTEKDRALLLEEFRVSELLPDKDLHERDAYWRAWIIGADNINAVLKRLNIHTSGTKSETIAMMQDYQQRDVSWFISDEILDVEIISDLNHGVRGVLLSLTS